MAQTPTDWIEWQGGECPVDANTMVNWRIVDRDGDADYVARRAGSLDWSWGKGDEGNIIAYRVVSK